MVAGKAKTKTEKKNLSFILEKHRETNHKDKSPRSHCSARSCFLLTVLLAVPLIANECRK